MDGLHLHLDECTVMCFGHTWLRCHAHCQLAAAAGLIINVERGVASVFSLSNMAARYLLRCFETDSSL
jgi:hypothetical protein